MFLKISQIHRKMLQAGVLHFYSKRTPTLVLFREFCEIFKKTHIFWRTPPEQMHLDCTKPKLKTTWSLLLRFLSCSCIKCIVFRNEFFQMQPLREVLQNSSFVPVVKQPQITSEVIHFLLKLFSAAPSSTVNIFNGF